MGALGSTALALCLAALAASEADARITRIEIKRMEPTFEGKTFGKTGAYSHWSAGIAVGASS